MIAPLPGREGPPEPAPNPPLMGLRPGLRRTVPVVVAACTAAALPSAAVATPSGGSFGSPAPRIEGVACVSACDAVDVARAGSLVRLTGSNLRNTAAVA